MRALVIGDLEVTRATCAMLAQRGVDVVHLMQPSDLELRTRFDADIESVAVLVRGDVTALRYVLLVEQIRPGVRLVATIFDRTLSDKVASVVPNCTVRSPADISVPSIIGACLADGTLAVEVAGGAPRGLRRGEDGALRFVSFSPRRSPLVRRLLDSVGQLRAHDDATRVLLLAFVGLTAIVLSDWLLTWAVLRRSPVEAFYAATRVVTTVGPGDADVRGRTWYLLLASTFMLLTVVITAIFTAGVVDRVMSSRTLTLTGRRVPPRRGHVVIVGLGQVGIRLAIALRALGIPVIVVEKDAEAPNLRLAKVAGVPVFIGHGQDVEVLRRVGLERAHAVAAMGSVDLDNIEVAIAASAIAPSIPIALRAGDNDVIAETRSLFRIGEVRDVSGLTAAAVVETLTGGEPVAVFVEGTQLVVFDGKDEHHIPPAQRCDCA